MSRFSEAGSVVDKAIAQKEVWDGRASGGRKRGVRGVSSMRKRSGSGGSGHRYSRGVSHQDKSENLMGEWLGRDRPAVRYDDVSYSSCSDEDDRGGGGGAMDEATVGAAEVVVW